MMLFEGILVKVLVVEDIEKELKAIEKFLGLISQNRRKALGISGFGIDSARAEDEAITCLKTAARDKRPYDLSLNDIEIPKTVGDDTSLSVDNGHKVMQLAISTGSVERIISFSKYKAQSGTIESFYLGKVEFLPKPYKMEQLQEMILSCLRNVLIERCSEIINSRVKKLMFQGQLGLAHYFTVPFSKLVTSMSRATGEIEAYARERYELDPDLDAQDGLMRQLRLQRTAISEASKSWLEKQNELLTGDDPSNAQVETLLKEIGESLLPCLAVKRTPLELDFPESAKFKVLTFQDDVKNVLEEIILGGLAKLPDYGDPKKIDVTLAQEDGQVAVRFEDSLDPIEKEDAEKINAGKGIVFDPNFGRNWGLSIAQYVAKTGGGELVVTPKDNGNTIVYRIPICYA